MSLVQRNKAKRQHTSLRSRLALIVATIAASITALPTAGVVAADVDKCLVREGRKPIINKADRSVYERKLFLTPDEMARYVFLTNRKADGDRSAAIYRGRRRRDSLPGDYRVAATVAADSLLNNPNVSIKRFDAPLPASLAAVLHELWLAVCQQSPLDAKALPSAPTGLFSVLTAKGNRVTAVTVSLQEEHSLCLSMIELGESLINYAKLPASQRTEAAGKIQPESERLLKRMSQPR